MTAMRPPPRLPAPLAPRMDLSRPRPLRVAFPLLLDGDLVMTGEHLGVSYLVSILRAAGADCRILEVAGPSGDAQCVQDLVDFAPDIVGFSLTTVTVSHVVAFGQALRAALGPETFFLAGGPLATYVGRDMMSRPQWSFLDGLVRGDGEVPMLRFAEAFHSGGSLDDVPSLTWRRPDGSVGETPLAPPLENLDILPHPARDQYEASAGRQPYLRLCTSRGCTSRCTFCNAPHAANKIAAGKLWRGQSPKRVVDELEALYRRYRLNTFDFIDSTFEDPGGAPAAKQRIREIAELILERDLKVFFNVCMQAKNWHEDDVELLDLLYRAGLEKVLIGIESGSATGLRRWKKKSTVEDNRRAIELLWRTGIYVAFGFIAFHPWSTFEEIRQNNDFLRAYMGHNLRRYTVRFELYPGAEAVADLAAEGLLSPEFHQTLNPLAYSFKDQRIARLARTAALLYGESYCDEGVIEGEPAVFRFETFDIVLHTYLSRILRYYRDNPTGAEILHEASAEADAIRSRMKEFNYALISEMVDLSEADRLEDAFAREQRPQVEAFYQERIAEFRNLQLRTGLRMHRAGLPIRSIAHVMESAS